MRCDFQKSECHFQSRSCSLYSFKGTDKILKGREVLTVTNVHMPYVGEGQKPLLHYLGASVCSYSRGKKDQQIQYLAPEKIRVLLYYLIPNTLKHTGNFGYGLHTTSFFHDKQNYSLSVLFGKALVSLFSLPCAKLQN